ncbi:phage tail spike protein [Schleiferilactobacillus perolens]|uniref:Uncharacterized protein n=1 Tax=Schleiferilactobacillus perolens DSM 12744 TaxID=1423792 RepID=A0A0R1MRW3_9LACO|nr:phage tail spike protein [Schleiferilactobacillus perolens]KRL10726.1 hypothetical protein FD09_GL000869 [Schleiferilactobacillus perolens DSM 12744]
MTEYLRFPILYQRASDDTSTLGLGYLTGILTGTVTRDANAVATLTLTYNPEDPLANELQKGRVILTDCGPDLLRQKFRITHVTKANNEVTIEANQIWGDLAYDVISKDISMPNASPADSFNAIASALADPIPALNFSSDISKVANISWTYKDTQNVLDILIGADKAGDQTNSMQALYSGEWVADNYNLKLLQHGGRDTHMVVKYGRNIQTIEQDEAIDQTYTAIMPFATYTPSSADAKDTSTSYDGAGIVQYVGTGGLQMYDSPYKGHKVVGTIKNGAYYKVTRTATENTVNDNTWYMIGTNNWVDGTFFKFDKSGAYIVNNVSGAGTITIGDNTDSNGLIVPFQGMGSVTSYAGPKSIAIWTSPWADKKATGQYVGNGERFKIWYKATDNVNHVWYNIGTNSWIDSTYFSVEKNTNFVVVPARGIVLVKTDDAGGAPVYTAPGGAGYVQRHVAKGTRWQVTGAATGGDGKTWYRIATNQWITDDVCDFNSNGTVTPTTVDDKNKETAQALGKVPIYPKPTYNVAPTGQYLQAGTRWKITAQADNNGTTWYEVAINEWVDSKWFSFSTGEDVTPVGPNAGDEVDEEVAEVTVTLPELLLKSDLAANDERLRVLPVDLSQYNIEDADRLKEVAQAYMSDYRIGYPTVSLTLNYAQLTGDYARLTQIGLYDRVAVEFDQLDISEDAEVSEVIWNVVAKRYDSITIGEPPISYTHELQKYQQQQIDKATSTITKTQTGLFDQIHNALKLQGADQDAAVRKIMEELGMHDTAIESVKAMMKTIDDTVTDVSDWIKNPGTAVIQAYPNWQAPIEFRVVNDDKSSMRLNNHGLGYYSSSGLVRTAITSDGRIVAEAITAGTVTGLKLMGAQITGTSNISLDDGMGGHRTEISSAYGISTSGTLEVTGTTRIHGPFAAESGLTLTGTLDVTGYTNLHGDLNASGNITAQGSLVAGAASAFWAGVTVHGSITGLAGIDISQGRSIIYFGSGSLSSDAGHLVWNGKNIA